MSSSIGSSLKVLCIATFLVGVTYAEVTTFDLCPEVSQNACTISKVRITPCNEPGKCKLVKGTTPSIAFTFIPHFSSSKLKTGLYWPNTAGIDVPFTELNDANGCDLTPCPVESGKSQDLNYSLQLGTKLPTGQFTFKWKLWNEEDPTQACCFLTKISLKKPRKTS